MSTAHRLTTYELGQMDFENFGVMVIVTLLVAALFQLIPIVIMGIGGTLCLRKGYRVSGTLILLSLLPIFINHFGSWVVARLTLGSGMSGILTMAYVTPVCGFLGNLLVASGVLTLIRAVAARPRAQ